MIYLIWKVEEYDEEPVLIGGIDGFDNAVKYLRNLFQDELKSQQETDHITGHETIAIETPEQFNEFYNGGVKSKSYFRKHENRTFWPLVALSGDSFNKSEPESARIEFLRGHKNWLGKMLVSSTYDIEKLEMLECLPSMTSIKSNLKVEPENS